MLVNRIKALRENTGLNQKEFAEKLGIKATTYNGYETGSHEPKSDFLILLAKEFNVTVDYILGLSDIPNLDIWNRKRIYSMHRLYQPYRFYSDILAVLHSRYLDNKKEP